jgi:hypothetical protein
MPERSVMKITQHDRNSAARWKWRSAEFYESIARKVSGMETECRKQQAV